MRGERRKKERQRKKERKKERMEEGRKAHFRLKYAYPPDTQAQDQVKGSSDLSNLL